jgi:hypothetical protein
MLLAFYIWTHQVLPPTWRLCSYGRVYGPKLHCAPVSLPPALNACQQPQPAAAASSHSYQLRSCVKLQVFNCTHDWQTGLAWVLLLGSPTNSSYAHPAHFPAIMQV